MGHSDEGPPERDHSPGDEASAGPTDDASPEDTEAERRSQLRRRASDLKRAGELAFREGHWDDAVGFYVQAKQIGEELGDRVLLDDLAPKLLNAALGRRRRCRVHHRVLVVDDDQHWRTLVRTQLRLDGGGHFQDVRYAFNAFDAIEALGTGDDSDADTPDVIFLDLHLPDMSGIEALSLIRKGAPKAKVVMISAYGAGPFRTVARERGALRYLDKSEIKNFAATLRDICCV